MRMHYVLIMALGCLSANSVLADSPAVTKLLSEYAAQGANNPDANAGRLLWFKTFNGNEILPKRSCTTCHTSNLKNSGNHVKTKKVIDPMAPSVNPERLNSAADITKWFKRNCKWTLGRECTVPEKANLLAYINQQ